MEEEEMGLGGWDVGHGGSYMIVCFGFLDNFLFSVSKRRSLIKGFDD